MNINLGPDFVLHNRIRAHDLPKQLYAYTLSRQDREPPVRAYPGQSFDALMAGADNVDQGNYSPFTTKPCVDVNFFTVEKGYFVISPGLDGMILTEDQRIVEEPSCFCDMSVCGYDGERGSLPLSVQPMVLDEVFIGFDAAWRNPLHWIAFDLPRLFLASRFLPQTCQIVLPDTMMPQIGAMAAKEAAASSLAAKERDGYLDHLRPLHDIGPRQAVTYLEPGLYRARKIHFIWHDPRNPIQFTQAGAYQEFFSHIRLSLRADSQMPKRLFIAEDQGRPWPLTEAQAALLQKAATDAGFVTIDLREMDFATRCALFYNAEMVLAPHGAGLTNMLFARRRLKVLEINRRYLGAASLPPLFYMMASAAHHPYMFLDADGASLTEERLAKAIENFATV